MRREARHARRHLPQRRLHPVQGSFARPSQKASLRVVDESTDDGAHTRTHEHTNTQALLHASHLYHDAGHNYAKYGVMVDKVSINLPAMMSSKDKAVTGLTRGIAHLFKKNKVSHAPGLGTIKSPTEVAVTAADGSVGTIRTKNILIATGSDIVGLPFLKIDEKTVVSSTGALSLSAVPKKMVVIGGGVIGLELGSVWSRLGAEVTVVEFLPRIAAGADSKIAYVSLCGTRDQRRVDTNTHLVCCFCCLCCCFCSDEFQKILTSQGIKFKTSSKVTAVNKVGDVHKISVEPAAGGATETVCLCVCRYRCRYWC